MLLAADGVASTRIAERVGVSPATVKSWRDRFGERGLKVNNDDPRPFAWKATADSILANIRRGRVTLDRITSYN
ncbi:MAG: helix-turn-helix domain-containing protein [Dehalococcoidia bacterium]